ncbi:hypothetical protein HDU96_004397 [Phlyctochytrium bullatum]|nr:hypothetical protein HDU96_004397 [Phlyctochytrium bullatum]
MYDKANAALKDELNQKNKEIQELESKLGFMEQALFRLGSKRDDSFLEGSRSREPADPVLQESHEILKASTDYRAQRCPDTPLQTVCVKLQVENRDAVLPALEKIEQVVRCVPPLENFVLQVDECVSRYSGDKIYCRPLDKTLSILNRWGENAQIYAVMRDFKADLARELMMDPINERDTFLRRIRYLVKFAEGKDTEDTKIAKHVMELFGIPDKEKAISFMDDVFVSWAQTKAGR